MPFTLFHPAAILPLHRFGAGRFSLPALAIGSMAPDFVYFLSLGVSGRFTHSAAGVLTYCVPAGLLVYLAYFMLIRAPLLAWLPSALSARMAPHATWRLCDAASAARILISLAIGAATHVMWDSFTHANAVIVDNLSVLRSIIAIGPVHIPVYKMLQQLSNLAGLVIIAAYGLQWFRRTKPGTPHPAPLSTALRILTLATVCGAGLLGGIAGLFYRSAKSIEHGLFNAVVTGMAASALAIALLCLMWRIASGAKIQPQ